MGRKKKDWSSEKERLESLYETLGSIAAVARQYGVTRERMRQIFSRIGIRSYGRCYRSGRLPMDQVLREYESGVPSGVLAKRYNIDQTTLLRALRLSGAQMKEVGRPKDGSK